MKHASRLLSSAVAIVLADTWCGVAGAAAPGPQQTRGEAADTASAAVSSLEEVLVTGSRVRRDGFDAPNPLTVVSREQIEQLGQVSVAETLNVIPQNTAFQSDTNVGIVSTPNIGSNFANLRGLNPFFGTRTLTLVDSRRFVPTSDGGAVDLNMIPSMLVSRIETVTGGASAAYGSDAVAGVVNVILDKSLDGTKSQFDVGQTFRGDGRNTHASLATGLPFAEGRGHFLLGAEYQDSEGVGDCAEVREWCAAGWDIYNNSGIRAEDENGVRVASGYNVPGSPTYGQPNYVIGPDSRQAFNVSQGVFRDLNPTPAALRFMRFNDAGTAILDMDPGLYVSNFTFGPRQGGDGDSTYGDSALRAPIKRFALLSHARYDLTDTLEGTFEMSYGGREVSVEQLLTGPRSTYYINADNAYLPASVAALFPEGGQASLGKDVDGDYSSVNNADARTFRAVAGLNGAIGSGMFQDWSWDAYYQYGRNTREQFVTNARVNSFFQYSLDAVRDPDTGEIVCRAVLQGNPDAAGCVPMNLFGLHNLTPQALAYAWRTTREDFEYDQHVLAGSMSGDVYEGFGAGAIGAAFGAEYRTESGDVTHGNIPYYNDFAFTFGQDFGGDIDVLEGFVEVNVPVLRDAKYARFLEFNTAVRQTHNSNRDAVTGESKSTDITSWKMSAIYDPVDWLRLRSTRSRDIRAAGFRELYQKSVPSEEGTTQGRVNNPFNGNVLDPTPILGGGDFALTPETADTTTVGVVLTPSGIAEGLRFSADWYEIKINDAITSTSGQELIDFCFNLGTFCDRITFNPAASNNSDITFIKATQVNLSTFTSRGVDFEADYSLPLSRLAQNASGYLNLRLLAAWNYDLLIGSAPGAPVINFAGQTGPNPAFGDFNSSPKWLLNTLATYGNGGFSTTVNIRYVDSGKLNVQRIGPDSPNYDPTLPNSISDNTVDSAYYVTLAMSYAFDAGFNGSELEVFGVINNLLDKDPPVAPGGGGGGGSNYPTNPVYFDTLGAQIRAGFRLSF